PIVTQHRREDETAKRRLATNGLFGFPTNFSPDGIHLRNPAVSDIRGRCHDPSPAVATLASRLGSLSPNEGHRPSQRQHLPKCAEHQLAQNRPNICARTFRATKTAG